MKNIFIHPAFAIPKPEGSGFSALFAGLSLVIMALAAMIAYGFIHGRLVILDDATATAANITAQLSLFRVEIAMWSLIAITDIIVSLALWRYFVGVNSKLSLLTALLRLVYTVFLVVGIINLAKAAGSPDALKWVDSFERIWSIGLIVFGCHLTLLAILTFRSGYVPAIWSWLLIIAGPSYTLIHILLHLGPAFNQTVGILEIVLTIPMTIAELGFAFWLIFRGVRLIRLQRAAG